MKKFFLLVIATVLCICTVAITCFAGSVPEDLLGSDDAQVFFAKVTAYTANENMPTVELTPVKKVKGDVSVGTAQSYSAAVPVGNFTPIINDVYLFAYYDSSNPTYIFRVSSYDTKTLKIDGISGLDMWERFENHLNDGKYEEAELKRQSRLTASGVSETKDVSEELPPIKNYRVKTIAVCAILAVAFLAVIIIICLRKKARHS